MFRKLFRAISFVLLTILLSSCGSGFRQPTTEETKGGQALKQEITTLLRLPSTANWDEIYHSFFEQLEGTECLMLRAKIGLDGQCDWTVIIIAINTMNHPKIQEQASLDSATTSAIAQGIINMKKGFTAQCPHLTFQSSWENLFVCLAKKENEGKRQKLNFSPDTPIESVIFVWNKEKGSPSGSTGNSRGLRMIPVPQMELKEM